MKMGNIASPWRYDIGARDAHRLAMLRRPTIIGSKSYGAEHRVSEMPRPGAWRSARCQPCAVHTSIVRWRSCGFWLDLAPASVTLLKCGFAHWRTSPRFRRGATREARESRRGTRVLT